MHALALRPRITRIIIVFAFILLPLVGRASAATEGFLRVSGRNVLDATGKKVQLRGFNVTFKYFRGVLGEKDVSKISQLGANCIRLALDCRQFEPAPFRYDEDKFGLLSRVLAWAEKNSVYVVLDMHLVAGIQNPHDFLFHKEKTYRFWSERQYQKRYYALLAEFAKRYRNLSCVAGYDLMNEGVPPDTATYGAIMNKAAETIRTYDRNHILIVEEAIMPDGRKELIKINDGNAIYSIHFYFPHQFTPNAIPPDKAAVLGQIDYALNFSRRYNAPLYMGEFTSHENPSRESVEDYLSDLLHIMADKGIHWTYWEYYSNYHGIALYSGDAGLKRPHALKVLKRFLNAVP